MMRRWLLSALLLSSISSTAFANNASKVWINEILYNPVGADDGNQVIELMNLNTLPVVMTNWTICIHFIYTRFPSGATIQPNGGKYIIHLGATGSNTATDWFTGTNEVFDITHDSLSLYHNFSGFTTPSNMEDFVQWGAGAQPRENIANLANLWTTGTFVPLASEGQSVQFLPATNPPTLKHPISDYCNAAPTLFANNVCTPPMGSLGDLVISEVLHDPAGSNAGMTAVELLNTNSLPVDLTGLSLNTQLTGFTFPAGNSVPGNGLVVIHLNTGPPAPGILESRSATPGPSLAAAVDIYAFPYVDLDPVAGSFAIYKNNLDYTAAANMVDFIQWGAGGQARESVAVTKGIWTAGDFFGPVLEGTSIQWRGSGNGNLSTDWCADMPTLGVANLCSTSGLPGDHHRMMALGAARPNPFSASTAIEFTAAMTGIHARLTVFDLSGRPVRTLYDGAVRLGPTIVEWDGRDGAGSLVPGGLYFYRLDTPDETLTGKTMVVR